MPESNEQIVRRLLSYWSTRDAEAMANLFAPEGIYDNVPDRRPMVGRAAIRQWLDTCFHHLTRIDVEIINIAGNGEWVLTERIDDHIVGDRHMSLPVMGAARVVGGHILMLRDYYDRQMVRELGIG